MHKKEIEYKNTQIQEQQNDYDKLIERNRLSIAQIEQDRD